MNKKISIKCDAGFELFHESSFATNCQVMSNSIFSLHSNILLHIFVFLHNFIFQKLRFTSKNVKCEAIIYFSPRFFNNAKTVQVNNGQNNKFAVHLRRGI